MHRSRARPPAAAGLLARRTRGAARYVLVAVLYLAGWVALDAVAGLFQTGQGVSLWYVPTGLTMAVLLLGGLRYGPVLPLTDPLSAPASASPAPRAPRTSARP